jgi:AhpD family alkylhydroperoxidase
MRPTLPYKDLAPKAYQNLLAQYQYTRACGLEHGLLYLVELRASQINGCLFCMDMHATEAGAHGEHPRRLHALPGWRESAWFTPRERAALAWTEAMTRLSDHAVTADLVEEVRQHFTDEELVNLTHALALINAWNRLGVAFLPALPALEIPA